MSVRAEKVASFIKEELGMFFEKNFLMEEYGLMTVTEVRMSADLRYAKVFVSIYGDTARKKKSMLMLEAQKPSIRFALGKVLHLRFVPALTFVLDESVDRAMRIETLIKQIHSEQKDNSSDE
ncbi:MAG TPA: 30S ribosome-binding factor RbfA [Bacteroidota bacterium]|jgi:ribosome-binding factor A|nr:30S ribosome-binding factor RbfA [Bacteroidota bacterium]